MMENNTTIKVKIKSIKKLKGKHDVYNIIGVEDNNNFIANNIIVHNCDLFSRGVGAIFVKDCNPVSDSWRLSEFKTLGSYTEFNDKEYIEKILKKHPNFWNIIRFPKPPEWLYNKYLVVREKNVYNDANVLHDVCKEDIYRALFILTLRDIMLHDVSLNLARVILHIKNEYDIVLNKTLVESIIEDAKQLIIKIREQGITSFGG